MVFFRGKSLTFTVPKQASDYNTRLLEDSPPAASSRASCSWAPLHVPGILLPVALALHSSHLLPVAAKTSRLPLQPPGDNSEKKLKKSEADTCFQ